jgi:deoxyribodipyrimidine photo-lyase
MTESATLLWFRADLRLQDNPALVAALTGGGPLVPCYVDDPDAAGAWAPGAASRAWLAASIESLSAELESRGSRLVVLSGPAERELVRIARETSATRLVFARRHEPWAKQQQDRVCEALDAAGVGVEASAANALTEPGTVLSEDEAPYRVFTPFYKRWQAIVGDMGAADHLSAPPSSIPGPEKWPASAGIGGSGSGKVPSVWEPGESGALQRLAGFLDGPASLYGEDRDRPDVEGTSQLSPHLAWGEISAARVLEDARSAREAHPEAGDGVEAYVRQLCWREFAQQVLAANPHTTDEPLRPEFAAFPWRDSPDDLDRWRAGTTGFPLVDAGMRELAATGWMHNRVRMVVASFLTKDLLIPWQTGARVFWDSLVDADLANNTFGWQWTAGSGADAAPFFRVFNPMLQANRFDPDGTYVRRWIPELEAGSGEAAAYPEPMLDHAEARERALAALEATKG